MGDAAFATLGIAGATSAATPRKPVALIRFLRVVSTAFALDPFLRTKVRNGFERY
jgi:hypothetical protein